MTEEPDHEHLLHRLFEQLSQHIETRYTYITLSGTEKLSAAMAELAGAFTLFIFAVLVLFFFSMGFAWWLGDFLGNRAGGFALAGLVFIPIGALVYRWIRPFVQDRVIKSVLEEDEETDKTNQNG